MNRLRYFFPRHPWIAAVCVLLLGGCGRTSSNDPVMAMDELFKDLSKQHFQEAYHSAAITFQMQLSETAFEAICRDLGLSNFTSCIWTPESVAAKEAHLKGEFLSKDNQTLFLYATLIKESGQWKLFALSTPSEKSPTALVDIFSRIGHGLGFNDAFTRPVPDDQQTRELVSETMQKFNECLHQKNFDSFYADTSTLWQSQTTPEQVARAFKPFVDAGITMDFIKDMKVIFDEPPRFNSEGYLLVKGYYPSRPNRIIFDLKYVFELPKWKLLGVTINVKP